MKPTNRLAKKRSLTLMSISVLMFSFTFFSSRMSPIQRVQALPNDLRYYADGSLYTIENSYVRIRHNSSLGYTDIYRLDAGILAINGTHPKLNYIVWRDTYLETSPIVIADDDQTGFWIISRVGNGSYDLSISDDEETKVIGVNSLKYTVGRGRYARLSIQYYTYIAQDWSAKGFISFHWYGTNSGQKDIALILYAPDACNQFWYSWNDDWMGWERITIPFQEMNTIGNPDISKITFIEIRIFPSVQTTYYLDRLIVEGVPFFDIVTSTSITRREDSLIMNVTYTNKDDMVSLVFNLESNQRFFFVKADYTNLNETYAKAVKIFSPIVSGSVKPTGETWRTLIYQPKKPPEVTVTDQDFSWLNGSKMRSFSLKGSALNLPVMLMMNTIDKLVFLAAPITDTIWTPHLSLEKSSSVYGFSSLQLNFYSHANLKMPIIVNPKGKIETETFLVGFYKDVNDAIASYRAILLKYYDFPTTKPYLMFGTWRTHGPDINEANVEALADYLNQTWLPYHDNVVLEVSAGWEKAYGDWEPDPIKFPNGLEPVIAYIESKGLKAGIWLALYTVQNKSRLFREHPDWLLRDTHARLVSAFEEGEYFLDSTHPDVQRWIKATLQRLHAMGFTLFKIDHWASFDVISYPLDFYKKNTTLVEARNIMLQTAYDALKHEPDVVIHQTFCRNPLTLRFAHTIYTYDFPWPYSFFENVFWLMLRNTFESMFSPASYSIKFFDYVLTNKYGFVLSDSQTRLMLASEFVSGGIVTLGGEKITNVTRIQMLGRLIPAFTPQSVKLIDISNDTQMYEINYQRDSLSWKYLALLNLNKTQAKSFSYFLEREYFGYEIFTQKSIGIVQNVNIQVPPFDARVIVLVPTEKPTILTTSRHFVNIPERISINFTPQRLTITLPLGATAVIFSPYADWQILISGKPYTPKLVSANLYEFKAQVSRRIELIGAPMRITYLTDPSVTVRYGDSSIIITRLINDKLNAIPGHNVDFYLHYKDSWHKIGSAITNSTGYASIVYTAKLIAGEYKLKAEFSGNLTPNEYYEPTIYEGYLKVIEGKLEVDISVSMPVIYVGEKTTITATVTSGGNKIPYLHVRIYAGEGLIGAAYTDKNGTVSIYWNPKWAGIHIIKAEVDGGTFYESYVKTTSVSVEWPPLLMGVFTSVSLILSATILIIFLKKRNHRK